MVIEQELKQVEQLTFKGQYEEALQKVEALEKVTGLTDDEYLSYLLLKSEILYLIGEYDQALNIANQSFQESEKLDKPLRVIDSVLIKGFILFASRKYDESNALVEKGEQILKSITNVQSTEIKRREAGLYELKGRNQINIGELFSALEFGQKSLSLREDLGTKPGIAFSLQLIGDVYRNKGELDRALEYMEKTKTIGEELGHKFLISLSYYSIGGVYLSKGKLDQALEYFQKILALQEILPLTLKPDIFNNIGVIFINKGENDQALKYYNKSLALNEAKGNRRSIAINLGNLGEAYIGQGDYNTASDCLKRSLEIYREIGNDHGIAEGLYVFIREFINDLPSETISRYLDEFREINDRHKNIPLITQKYRLAKAIVLKNSGRLPDKMTALSIFKEIADEEIVWYELTVTAMIYLGELLLFELKTTGSETVLKEVKELTEKLHTVAESQHSYWLLTETYLLQSKLALLELNLEQAQELLTQAKKIAAEKGLSQLEKAVSVESNLLSSQLSKWEKIADLNPSLVERMELTQLSSLLERMLHKKYNEEEVIKYAEEARQLVEAWEK